MLTRGFQQKNEWTSLHDYHLHPTAGREAPKEAKVPQSFIRILMFLILHKATRRAAGCSPNALKSKTYGNRTPTYCFPELAVFLKKSEACGGTRCGLCKQASHFVARTSLFIPKPQTDQCCPQEQSKEIKPWFCCL